MEKYCFFVRQERERVRCAWGIPVRSIGQSGQVCNEEAMPFSEAEHARLSPKFTYPHVPDGTSIVVSSKLAGITDRRVARLVSRLAPARAGCAGFNRDDLKINSRARIGAAPLQFERGFVRYAYQQSAILSESKAIGILGGRSESSVCVYSIRSGRSPSDGACDSSKKLQGRFGHWNHGFADVGVGADIEQFVVCDTGRQRDIRIEKLVVLSVAQPCRLTEVLIGIRQRSQSDGTSPGRGYRSESCN